PTQPASPTASPTSIPSPSAVPERTAEIITYRARPGDTYGRIALQAEIDLAQMMAMNGLTESSIIQVGEPIQLPIGAIPPDAWPPPPLKAIPTFTTNMGIAGSPEIQLGRDDRKWITLTFDTGADPEVQREILAVLREHDVKATFFLLGSGVEADPAVVSDVIADGHELANHSFSHRSFLEMSPAQILDELRRTEAAVKAVDPSATTKPWFRAPFGYTNDLVRQVVQDEGYYIVNWTMDSMDWVEGVTAEEIAWTIRRATRPGAIIVQHGSSRASAEALQQIVPELMAEGYEFKMLSEILAP
ncbi:MAG: polysaccharide deacetylase family protein, partial [Chloroflexota bacterium]|nr:polysaccharide deacetylase family protein [Chloroflexota bacterium]